MALSEITVGNNYVRTDEQTEIPVEVIRELKKKSITGLYHFFPFYQNVRSSFSRESAKP